TDKDRLPSIVAGMINAKPDLTLQEICDRLKRMRETTPRGKVDWFPSSVKLIIERAHKLGLIDAKKAE
ncbi:MAG: recombinase family protein, partial [Roseibium sp.]